MDQVIEQTQNITLSSVNNPSRRPLNTSSQSSPTSSDTPTPTSASDSPRSSYMTPVRKSRPVDNASSSALTPVLIKNSTANIELTTDSESTPYNTKRRLWYNIYKNRHILQYRWDKGFHQAKLMKGHQDSVYCIRNYKNLLFSGSVCIWQTVVINYCYFNIWTFLLCFTFREIILSGLLLISFEP